MDNVVPSTSAPPAATGSSLRRSITRAGWLALAAAGTAWFFEVFDAALLSLTIPALTHDFSTSKAALGTVATAQALTMVVGGIAGGALADRSGRVRALSCAMIVYAILTGLAAMSSSLIEFGILRALAGLGMGATWSAGSALVAETWPARHRAKGGAIMQAGLPLGSATAIGVATLVTHLHGGLADGGWRWLYLLGALPLVFAVLIWIRIPESPLWQRNRGPAKRPHGFRALVADRQWRPVLTALVFLFFVQYVYWAISTFLPTFLTEVDGLTFTSGASRLLLQQLGALVGFAVFALLADRFGRRPTFIGYLVVAAVATALLVTSGQPLVVPIASFLAGVGVSGVFAGAGPWVAEMTHRSPVRALAMGTAYNGGRLGGALAPAIVGLLATSPTGFRIGLGTAVLAAVVAIVVIALTPETRGRELS
ncbi:MFS transporter [Amycolatopsis thermoflava]